MFPSNPKPENGLKYGHFIGLIIYFRLDFVGRFYVHTTKSVVKQTRILVQGINGFSRRWAMIYINDYVMNLVLAPHQQQQQPPPLPQQKPLQQPNTHFESKFKSNPLQPAPVLYCK